MTPFSALTSLAAPLLRDNIDTDTIIPSREMRSTARAGLRDGLFAPWRYSNTDRRIADPDFVLNRPEFAAARVLAVGANFGCGSSREHAVWALAEWGIRAIIGESFAPIFAQNCLRNGVLLVVLDKAEIDALAGAEVTVDLVAQAVRYADKTWPFAIEPEHRAMLLDGLDAIDLTLEALPAIDAWTAADRARRPWVYLEHHK